MKIPTYESELTPNAPQLSVEDATQGAREIKQASSDVGSIGDKLIQVRDTAQSNEAEVKFLKRLSEIHGEALTKVDPWEAPKYVSDQMQQAINESGRGISSGLARNEFQQKASLEGARRSVAINHNIYEKQLKIAKASVTGYVDAKVQEYQTLTDPSERGVIRQQIIDKVGEGVNRGFINSKEATAYIHTNLHNADIGQVKNDMALNASAAYREIQKGVDGLYPYLNTHERSDLMQTAEKLMVKQEHEQKQVFTIAQNKNESDMLDKWFSGALQPSDIMDAHTNGKISEGFARSMTNVIEAPAANPKGKPDAKAYMDLVDKIQGNDAKPEDIRKEILDLNAQGKISASAAKSLYTTHMRTTDEGKKSVAELMGQNAQEALQIINKSEEQNKQRENDNGWWKGAVDYIKSWGKSQEKSPEAIAKATQDFFDKAASSNTKPAAALSAAKELINDKNSQSNPRVLQASEKGTLMIDAKGNRAIVYPDGRFEEQ